MTHDRSIPDHPDLEQLSRAYLASGLSLLPIALNGGKEPWGKLLPLIGDVRRTEMKRSWIPMQTRHVLIDELDAWIAAGAGIGIIGGRISGNLEIIDLDAPDLCELWREMVQEIMPGLLDRLPCVLTPRRGWHVYYRCQVIEGNQKLAENRDKKTLIETRGKGGYVVAPGSPPACHPLQKSYELIRGDLTQIPTITADERQILLSTARSFNERPQKQVYQSRGKASVKGDRPGDLYSSRVSWHELMTSIGATATGTRGDATLWKRPGKTTPGYSAITGNGADKLYVFSSNFAPFEPDTAYDHFAAYATWFHDSDFRAAAKALAAQGYGRNGRPGDECNVLAIGDEPPPIGEDEGKSIIRLTTDVTRMLNTLQRAIMALPKGPHLFQRARQLSIISRGGKPPTWLDRQADASVILRMPPGYLLELATQAARWEQWDGRHEQWKPALPPDRILGSLMARPEWPFPTLEGIVCTPTLRADGKLIDRPGYDADTGLYLDFNGTTFPQLRPHPALDDARTAIDQLREVFADFPFTAPHHRSAALASLISLMVRHLIQGCVPLFAVRSTVRGAGKGLLIDVVSLIATGRSAPRWAPSSDPEEDRKRMMAIAMAGDAIVHIDNVTRPLGSEALDSALTTGEIADRILGQTAIVKAPWHTVLFASGNNMQFLGDMARRVVPIDIDPKTERPEERDDFTHPDLRAWVLHERPQLVVAALTIVRAYYEAGSPAQQLKPLGSFEEWSNIIRHALVWAGEPDPCTGRQEIEAESDPQYEALTSLMTAWFERYQTEAKTVREVKDDVDNHTVFDKDAKRDIIAPEWRDLHSALVALDRRGREVNLRAIGYALRRWRGRMIGDKCFMAHEDRHVKIQRWHVHTGAEHPCLGCR